MRIAFVRFIIWKFIIHFSQSDKTPVMNARELNGNKNTTTWNEPTVNAIGTFGAASMTELISKLIVQYSMYTLQFSELSNTLWLQQNGKEGIDFG